MRPRSRAAAVSFVLWAVVAALCAPATPQSSLAKPVDQQPGEYEYHALLAAPVADSEEFRDKYLLGSWMGLRSKLARRGLRFALLSIIDPFGNITGGRQRGASDYDLVGLGILLDTDRVLGWHGGTFHVGFAVNFGTSLSANYVGNSFPIQLADVADTHPRLTYLSFTQAMFEHKLSIRLGRLTFNSVASEEFMGSEYFKAFSSVGIALVPLGVFINAPGAFGYPDTTWGARIKFQPVKQFYSMVGVYNGDPTLKNGVHHGFDFSMRGPLFLIAEVAFRRSYSKGLPNSSSNLKFGGYYNGGTSAFFGAGVAGRPFETERGRYGLYIVADQVLWRFGDPAQSRHLGSLRSVHSCAKPAHKQSAVLFRHGTGHFRSVAEASQGFPELRGRLRLLQRKSATSRRASAELVYRGATVRNGA